MATSTLLDIKKKARLLSKSTSANQLTDAILEDYINTYLLYDLPLELVLPSLKKTFTATTRPNDERVFVGASDFYALRNTYTSIQEPFYVARQLAALYTDKELFFSVYPQGQYLLNNVHTGNGALVNFAGTLSGAPFQKGSVSFSSLKADNTPLTLQDDGAGLLTGDGTGTINYLSGAYTLIFAFAPAISANIYAQYLQYKAQKPNSALFFEDKLVLRPIPDKVYEISFTANLKPTQLLADTANPELNEWWQLIAMGAAKKILEDRGDTVSLERINPLIAEQIYLLRRRASMQLVDKRALKGGSARGLYGYNRF